MSDIQITPEELRTSADAINTSNLKLDGALRTFAETVIGLKSWEGSASQEVLTKINALKPHFEDYKTVLEGYVSFLRDTAVKYEGNESTLKNNAGNLNGSAFK